MPSSKAAFVSKRTKQTLDEAPELGKDLDETALQNAFAPATRTRRNNNNTTKTTNNTTDDENTDKQTGRPMQFALKHDAVKVSDKDTSSDSDTNNNSLSRKNRFLRSTLLQRSKHAKDGPTSIHIQDLSPVSTAAESESEESDTQQQQQHQQDNDEPLLTQQTNDTSTVAATPMQHEDDNEDDNNIMDLPDDDDDDDDHQHTTSSPPLPTPAAASTPFDDELADSLTPPAAPPTNEEHDDLIPPSPPESEDDDDLDGGANYGMDDDDAPPAVPADSTTEEEAEEEEEPLPAKKKHKKAPKSAMKKKKKRSKRAAADDSVDDDDRRVSIEEAQPPPRKKKKTTSRFATTFSPKGRPLPREYEVIPVSDIKEQQGTPTPGLRRSKRTKCKPLQYWKGEKAEFGPMSESAAVSDDMMDMPEVKGYVYAKPTPHKPLKPRPAVVSKKAGRPKSKAVTTVHHAEELPPFDSAKLRKNYSIVDGEDALLWDDGVEESRTCKVVSHIGNMESRKLPQPKTRSKSEGKVVGLAAQAFNQSNGPKPTYVGYITGNLTLPSKGIKDAESVGGCAQVFTVVTCQPGALEVAYSDPEDEDDSTFNPDTAQRFLLEPRSMFRVPPGNTYRLCNHSKTTEAFLTWTIIRPVIQPQDVDSRSSG